MGPIIVLALIVVAIRIAPLFASSNLSAQQKALQRIPVTKIGAVAEGTRVRIVGSAAQLPGSDEFVTGPYSGRHALAVVYERYALGRRRERMELLDRQVRSVAFAIADESGTIALDLTHARFALAMTRAELAESGDNRVFGANIIASNQWELMDNDEGGVVPGDRLTVSGRVTRDARGVLVLAGTEADPVVVVALQERRRTPLGTQA